MAEYALEALRTISPHSHILVEATVLAYVPKLLDSSNIGVQVWICEMLCGLAKDESTAGAVRNIELCERLVALSRRVFYFLWGVFYQPNDLMLL